MKKIAKQAIFLVCVSMFMTSGCVPVINHRPIPLRYEPIDTIIRVDGRIEYVYVPRFRPRPMYRWDGIWYDEPYRYIPYQDLRGRVSPRRIPKRLYDKIERQAPAKPITPHRPMNGRKTIRRRTKRQK